MPLINELVRIKAAKRRGGQKMDDSRIFFKKRGKGAWRGGNSPLIMGRLEKKKRFHFTPEENRRCSLYNEWTPGGKGVATIHSQCPGGIKKKEGISCWAQGKTLNKGRERSARPSLIPGNKKKREERERNPANTARNTEGKKRISKMGGGR